MKKKASFGIGFEGRYQMIAYKPDGSSRLVADWFENLILDAGLDRLGTGGVLTNCQVGAGSTAPHVGQTALISPIATTTEVTNDTIGTDDPAFTYCFVRRTFRFLTGEAEGNLSEVGVGWSTSCFSRSLIKDDLGDPTTITILEDEILDVIYECRAYPNLTETTFTLTINSIDYDFAVRPIGLTGSTPNGAASYQWPNQIYNFLVSGFVSGDHNGVWAFGWSAIGSDFAFNPVYNNGPDGTAMTGPSGARYSEFIVPYSAGSYERKLRFTFTVDYGDDPISGFHAITRTGNYQISVDPAIPKDSTKILTIDYTCTWARREI